MEHDIPAYTNFGVLGLMKSPEMRALMREKAELVEALYREIVAKRTRRLARSTRIETHVGGIKGDRWEATVLVGDGAPYAASHEFGYDDGDTRIVAGFRDLNQALTMLGGLS